MIRAIATSSMTAPRTSASPPAARRASRRTSEQPPRRRRHPRTRAIRPAERIQHREEVDERRNDDPFPRGLGSQHGHLRDHVQPVRARGGHQAGQRTRVVRDVGVGEQQELGVAGAVDAAAQGPQLAGPSGRGLCGGGDRGADARVPVTGGLLGQGPGDLRGPVGGAVVDEDQANRPGIVLGEQGRERYGQHVGLVPGRDDDRYAGPRWRCLPRGEPLVGAPEETMTDGQIQPGEQ